jgi:hypothetical protein
MLHFGALSAYRGQKFHVSRWGEGEHAKSKVILENQLVRG